MTFTLEPLRRLIKQAGAPRVSDDAAKALAASLENKTSALVSEAAKIATHSNRKTVLAEDVKLAMKVIEGV
jgi:histone H3/H4